MELTRRVRIYCKVASINLPCRTNHRLQQQQKLQETRRILCTPLLLHRLFTTTTYIFLVQETFLLHSTLCCTQKILVVLGFRKDFERRQQTSQEMPCHSKDMNSHPQTATAAPLLHRRRPHIGHVCLNFYIGRVPSWVKIIKYCARRRRSSRSSSSSSISLSVRIHINTINPRLLLEWSTRSPGDLQRIPSSTHTRHAVSQQAPHQQTIDVVGFTVLPARSDASVWVWRISCQRGRAGDGGGKEELLVEVQTTALSLLFGQIGRYVVCVERLVGYNLN